MEQTKNLCECGSESKLIPVSPRGWKLKRVCKECDKVLDDAPKISTFEGFIRAFAHGKLGKKTKLGKYQLSEDKTKVVYTGKGRNATYGTDVLALQLADGRIIGNASRLERCGSYRRGTEAPAQRVLFSLNMAIIPFNVFDEAGLNIQTAKVVEKGKEEKLLTPKMRWDSYQNQMVAIDIYDSMDSPKKLKTDKKRIIVSHAKREIAVDVRDKGGRIVRDKLGCRKTKYVKGYRVKYIDRECLEKRHFIGAMLLEVEDKQFLFDVDRVEIVNYRFNPFLAQLPNKCKTIAEAYEILKPKEVVDALKKGLDVKRQGEWFFIPTKKTPQMKDLPKEIQAGLKKRPNNEQYNIDESYVDIYDHDEDEIEQQSIPKSYLKNILPRYRPAILKRLADLNRAIKKYDNFVKKRIAFRLKYNYFSHGGMLRAGENRPNSVGTLSIDNGVHYVKGWVKHTGREHEDLLLKDWHIAVPNTATKNFTISGDID